MKNGELRTELKNFTQIRDHIEGLLNRRGIDKRTKVETLLVFEALYNDMLAQGIPEDTMLQVWGIRPFGDLKIKIGFEGSLYVPSVDETDEVNPESRVISSYGEKIENRYHGGRNYLILTAKRSSLVQTKRNLIALVLAILVYIPIVTLLEKNGQEQVIYNYVFYAEKLFTDAILSVGAPVTFFALLRNLTSMYITAEGNHLMRRLEINAMLTSVTSVCLAVFSARYVLIPLVYVYFYTAEYIGGGYQNNGDLGVQENATEIVDSIVNSSIFGSFETFSPFPVIVLALLTTYALCSAGKYYESIMKVVDVCYVLFSKMLSAVMYLLPVFSFLAMLDVLLMTGKQASIFLFSMTVTMPLAMIAMALFYLIRLLRAGVNPGPFTKKLVPLLRDNVVINSTIDAVPLNTRYCVTKFGFDRKRMEDMLSALSRVNLNGNCFIITYVASIYLIFNSQELKWLDIAVIGIVVFFLSLGAPNQPGSTLIGLLVIISYLKAPEIISLAIFSEAMFGGILSMTNAAGDIVTVAIAEKKEQKKAAKAAKAKDKP